jgi:hypothetical protein
MHEHLWPVLQLLTLVYPYHFLQAGTSEMEEGSTEGSAAVHAGTSTGGAAGAGEEWYALEHAQFCNSIRTCQ